MMKKIVLAVFVAVSIWLFAEVQMRIYNSIHAIWPYFLVIILAEMIVLVKKGKKLSWKDELILMAGMWGVGAIQFLIHHIR